MLVNYLLIKNQVLPTKKVQEKRKKNLQNLKKMFQNLVLIKTQTKIRKRIKRKIRKKIKTKKKKKNSSLTLI